MEETKEDLNETQEMAKAIKHMETALASAKKLTDTDVSYLEGERHLIQSMNRIENTFVRRDSRGWVD